MSMTAGTVSVDDDESVTGGDYARALYDADYASLAALDPPYGLPEVPTLGSTDPPWSTSVPVSANDVSMVQAARVAILRDVARRANAYASATVTYLTANAKARISTSTGGLQQVAAVDTDPPTATKDLPIV